VRGKDGVGAKMDSMDLEREKGITIQSAATYCMWNGSQGQLQTPQHQHHRHPGPRRLHDRGRARAARARRRDPGARLGQGRAEPVDHRRPADEALPRAAHRVRQQDGQPRRQLRARRRMLKEKLGHHPVKLQVPIGAGVKFKGIIDPIVGKAYYFDGETARRSAKSRSRPTTPRPEGPRTTSSTQVADVDDALAEKFLNEEPVSTEELRAAIRRATMALKMTPVMCGSAIKNKGVQLLLDGVVYYLPNPTEVVNEAHDQKRGREGRRRISPDKPFVGSRSSSRRTSTASSPTFASTRARSPRATPSTTPVTRCARCACRACSACTPTTAMRSRSRRPATSSRFYGVEALRRDLHRRQGQRHAHVDARARRRHLAGGRAEGPRRPRPTSRRR
jgi:elongation factor G